MIQLVLAYITIIVEVFMPPRPKSVRPSIDQVKIFVQGRFSRPINGSKLVFHLRMYVYEPSRTIQEP